MQRVNELVVRGPHAEIRKLVERMGRNPLVADWKRDPSSEERLNVGLDASSPGVLCFSLDDPPMRPVSLILKRNGWDELQVSSLITKDRRPLSDVEYNRTLGDFHANVLIPLSVGLQVRPEMSPPKVAMQEFLSPEALGRLEEFAAASQKGEARLPDWPRWNRFVVQAHRDGAYLGDDDLDYWLMDAGFSPEDRRDLLGEFESGRALLRIYDEERVH